MKNIFAGVCFCFMLMAGFAASWDEHTEEELSCRPVHGSITLPGILYDDLTPLAHATFGHDPVAVSKALYALPFDLRDEFIDLYLNRGAGERHRYFFARCRERMGARLSPSPLYGPVMETRLGAEVVGREQDSVLPRREPLAFHLGRHSVFIPAPTGFDVYDRAAARMADNIRDSFAGDTLAVFDSFSGRVFDTPLRGTLPLTAAVRHIQETTEPFTPLLTSYRVMVDNTWRPVGVSPPDATPYGAEAVRYRWNLEPFGIRDGSFCYGGYEKTVDAHGRAEMRYTAVAVILLPGKHVQVDMSTTIPPTRAVVEEVNKALLEWRDDILAMNQ